MLTIMPLILDENDDIYRQLRLDLLAIWRMEQNVSPIAYEFSRSLVEQKIEKFREQLTEEELNSLKLQVKGSPKKSKNQMRREQICFTCQEAWTLDHRCRINKGKNLWQLGNVEDKKIVEDENQYEAPRGSAPM